jgi:hypothetical protein
MDRAVHDRRLIYVDGQSRRLINVNRVRPCAAEFVHSRDNRSRWGAIGADAKRIRVFELQEVGGLVERIALHPPRGNMGASAGI